MVYFGSLSEKRHLLYNVQLRALLIWATVHTSTGIMRKIYQYCEYSHIHSRTVKSAFRKLHPLSHISRVLSVELTFQCSRIYAIGYSMHIQMYMYN